MSSTSSPTQGTEHLRKQLDIQIPFSFVEKAQYSNFSKRASLSTWEEACAIPQGTSLVLGRSSRDKGQGYVPVPNGILGSFKTHQRLWDTWSRSSKELCWCPEHLQIRGEERQLDSGVGERHRGQHAAVFKGLWEQRERHQKERGREERSHRKTTDGRSGKKVHSGSPSCWSEVKARANVTKTAKEKARMTREHREKEEIKGRLEFSGSRVEMK